MARISGFEEDVNLTGRFSNDSSASVVRTLPKCSLEIELSFELPVVGVGDLSEASNSYLRREMHVMLGAEGLLQHDLRPKKPAFRRLMLD